MSNWPQVTLDTDDYSRCFGCGKNNPIGLKLEFKWDGQTARAEFIPTQHYQGWRGLVHGGIVACLLDEAMTYAAMFAGALAVTAKMQVQLKRPAPINEPLVITSSVTRKTRKLIETKAAVYTNDGTTIAESTGTHFVADPGRKEANPADARM